MSSNTNLKSNNDTNDNEKECVSSDAMDMSACAMELERLIGCTSTDRNSFVIHPTLTNLCVHCIGPTIVIADMDDLYAVYCCLTCTVQTFIYLMFYFKIQTFSINFART